MTRPPLGAALFALGLAIWAGLCTVIAISAEPDVAPDTYALIYPQDGLKGLQLLVEVTFWFQMGALFAFAAGAGRSAWALGALALLVMAGITLDPIRDPFRTSFALAVALGLDVLWVRASLAPFWWLVLRGVVALSLIVSISIVAIFA